MAAIFCHFPSVRLMAHADASQDDNTAQKVWKTKGGKKTLDYAFKIILSLRKRWRV